MALTVHIGKTFDDPLKLDKNVSWIQAEGTTKNFGCQPTDNCDVLSPVLILAYNADIVSNNYVYIPDWHRYYFFKNPQILTGGRMSIQLFVDVLQSWAATVRNSEGIIVRASLEAPTMIPDPQYPLLTSQRTIQNAVFSNPHRYFLNSNDSTFILTTISGDYTPPTP